MNGQMKSTLVWDGVNGQGEVRIPESMGAPRADQMQGTPWEQLIELAGRQCYDSMNTGRGSEAYHVHWQHVNHASIAEHPFATVEITFASVDRAVEAVTAFLNRPCLWVETRFQGREPSIRATVNPRHVREWEDHSVRTGRGRMAQCLATWTLLREVTQDLAPRILPGVCETTKVEAAKDFLGVEDVRLAEPEVDEERWVTIQCIGSRGFSHEICRHGDWTGISMRSTRYVDESESPWVMHPLLSKFIQSQIDAGHVDRVGETAGPEAFELTMLRSGIQDSVGCARSLYQRVVKNLEPWLVARGVDKFTARKQARGAARGFLGNALQTELIFSFNVAQGLHILNMRASNAADAEIREVICSAIPALKECRFASSFAGVDLEPAQDGLGMALKGGGHR